MDPLELRRRKQEEARILIQVKGRKQMVVRQQAISASSLNQGDCFILVSFTVLNQVYDSGCSLFCRIVDQRSISGMAEQLIVLKRLKQWTSA